jgi:hypothetical protein
MKDAPTTRNIFKPPRMGLMIANGNNSSMSDNELFLQTIDMIVGEVT